MVGDVRVPFGFDIAEAVIRSPDLWLPQVFGREGKPRGRMVGIDHEGVPAWRDLEEALEMTVGWNAVDAPHVVIVIQDEPMVAMAHAKLVISSGLPCIAHSCGQSHEEWEKLYRSISSESGSSLPVLEITDSVNPNHYLDIVRHRIT